MTDCCSAAIKFLKAGVAVGQNGRSNLCELVDLGVGLLVEKENKKFQIAGQKSACHSTNFMGEK